MNAQLIACIRHQITLYKDYTHHAGAELIHITYRHRKRSATAKIEMKPQIAGSRLLLFFLNGHEAISTTGRFNTCTIRILRHGPKASKNNDENADSVHPADFVTKIHCAEKHQQDLYNDGSIRAHYQPPATDLLYVGRYTKRQRARNLVRYE
jgi:hypothetical protein